ncbi:MAG: hypothetical protein FWH20_11300, partial [Oscillospiraceae bacterium]|nr:hypothetical protein [Oscillospiraceae bacterium]
MKVIIILLVFAVLLGGCAVDPAPVISESENETVSEIIEVETQVELEEITTSSNPLSEIPYYGERGNLRLSSEQALAYARAITDAELLYANFGDNGTFDEFYPVLIDVAGDGVPLLMLVEKYNIEMTDWEPDINILFGYEDGEYKKIAQHSGTGL